MIDATGVGAGLASFLERALPGRVIPFVFSGRSKSDLGWGFLGVVESGTLSRISNCKFRIRAGAEEQGRLQAEFWRQMSFCEFQIVPGAEKAMRWGVPDGRRDGRDGELVHDDLLVSAALCACWMSASRAAGGPALVVKGKDPLEEKERILILIIDF